MTKKWGRESQEVVPFRKILCPTDFSESSGQAVEAARKLAARFGSELLLLHVVSPIPADAGGIEPEGVNSMKEQELEASVQRGLAAMTQRFQAQGLNARYSILPGNPADEIIRAADQENVELIILAKGNQTGLDAPILGSVANKVVRLSKRPVFTVGGTNSGARR